MMEVNVVGESHVRGGIEVLYCHHSDYNSLSVYTYNMADTQQFESPTIYWYQ